MNTLDFFKAILPPTGGYFMALRRPYKDKATGATKQGTIHKFYGTRGELADAVEQANERPDLGAVYHANQAFVKPFVTVTGKDGAEKKQWRVKDNLSALSHKTLWLDLDCGPDKAELGAGYATKTEAFNALKAFLLQTRLPTPLIIDSGGGIHAYWPFSETVNVIKWQQLANGLRAACNHFELRADSKCTTDCVRVLRPVGTLNRKYDPPRPVTAKNPKGFAATSYDTLFDIIANIPTALGKLIEVPTSSRQVEPPTTGNLGDLLAHQIEYPPSSLAVVAEHCAQVRMMRETLGDIGYEHWRGVIGVAAYCTDGAELAGGWSERRGETGHSQCDVQQRLDDWNAGPTTCEFFAANGDKGVCAGCKHQGKIKSPIRLGRISTPQEDVVAVEAVTEDSVPIELEIPSIPGFIWKESEKVMAQQYYDKDNVLQEAPFCRSRVFPVERIKDPTGQYVLRMRTLLPNKRYRDFDLPTATISVGGGELLKALGAYEIYPTDNKDALMRMTAFHRNWAEEIKAKREEMQRFTTFGWTADRSAFLLGSTLISRGKPDRKVMTTRGAAEKAWALDVRTGTAEGWCSAALALYDRPGMECLQYALLSGFGSIFTPYMGNDYHGIPCYLYSNKTGLGKSTVADLNLTAWGDLSGSKLGGSEEAATPMARYARMATYNNLPTNHDEITMTEPRALAKILFAMSNGMERIRCAQDGVEKTSDKWDCSSYITGNTDLLGLLAKTQGNTMAEAVRILQINLHDYNIPQNNPVWFTTTVAQAMENKGHVGEAFIRWAVNNPERTQELIREELALMSGDIVSNGAFRFYRFHMLCTLTAARVLIEELGLLSFDLGVIRNWAHQYARVLCGNVISMNGMTAEDALSRMLNEMAPAILVTYGMQKGGRAVNQALETPIYTPRDTVVGRLVHGMQGHMEHAGRLYVSIAAIRSWCVSNRMDPNAVIKSAADAGALIDLPDNRIYLGQGTPVPGGRVRAICIDTTKLHAAPAIAPTLTLVTTSIGTNMDGEAS